MAHHVHTRTRRTFMGLLAGALLLPALPSLAQMPTLPNATQGRNFPQTAKRGTFSPAVFPEVYIDGKLRRLSPGARIFSENNMLVLPNAVEQGSKLTVNYQEDGMGMISKIWMLTADEAKAARPKVIR